jgi:hypothetical protein
VIVGWVVRLGHVRGWMFMFLGVVVGGEPYSWVLAQHHLDHTLFVQPTGNLMLNVYSTMTGLKNSQIFAGRSGRDK